MADTHTLPQYAYDQEDRYSTKKDDRIDEVHCVFNTSPGGLRITQIYYYYSDLSYYSWVGLDLIGVVGGRMWKRYWRREESLGVARLGSERRKDQDSRDW